MYVVLWCVTSAMHFTESMGETPYSPHQRKRTTRKEMVWDVILQCVNRRGREGKPNPHDCIVQVLQFCRGAGRGYRRDCIAEKKARPHIGEMKERWEMEKENTCERFRARSSRYISPAQGARSPNRAPANQYQ